MIYPTRGCIKSGGLISLHRLVNTESYYLEIMNILKDQRKCFMSVLVTRIYNLLHLQPQDKIHVIGYVAVVVLTV